MKQSMIAVCMLALAGSASAQPQEIESDAAITLTVGQAKAFQFDEPIVEIQFTHKDIAEGVPRSDRELTLAGLNNGTTRMFVRSTNSKLIYDAVITVTQDRGRLVRIYGSNKNDDLNAGYTAVYCTEFGCERPDKDLPKPTSITVERVSSGHRR